MPAWLAENLGTILLTLVLAGVVVLIVWSLRRNKKKGRHTCGGACAHCALRDTCHKQ